MTTTTTPDEGGPLEFRLGNGEHVLSREDVELLGRDAGWRRAFLDETHYFGDGHEHGEAPDA